VERGRVCISSDRDHDHRLDVLIASKPAIHEYALQTISREDSLLQTMPELPLADATPLRVTGVLFQNLIFAFEPQDIPDGALILRTLKARLLPFMTWKFL
jgi:hypothetical protein